MFVILPAEGVERMRSDRPGDKQSMIYLFFIHSFLTPLQFLSSLGEENKLKVFP